MPYGGSLAEVSNRATWRDCIELRDDETGELVDFTGAQEIVVQLLAQIYESVSRYGYGMGVGGSLGALMLTATLSNGKITIVQPGIFELNFTRGEMMSLSAGMYNVGVTITKDDETVELIIGTVTVMEGYVTVNVGSG